jgi:anti-sigma factor RsiW
MNVTREVILDLLPAYLSGEASPATRTLVEEHIKQDAELAQRLRLLMADNLAKAAPPHATPSGLAEVALWFRDIFLSHVTQQ